MGAEKMIVNRRVGRRRLTAWRMLGEGGLLAKGGWRLCKDKK
jgi:hypothetical protein